MNDDTENTPNPLIGGLMATITCSTLSLLAILAIKFLPGWSGNLSYYITIFSVSFTATLFFSILAIICGFKFFITCLKYGFTTAFVALGIIISTWIICDLTAKISSGLKLLLM